MRVAPTAAPLKADKIGPAVMKGPTPGVASAPIYHPPNLGIRSCLRYGVYSYRPEHDGLFPSLGTSDGSVLWVGSIEGGIGGALRF
jgi:hypothetical protein